jgi:TonB-dependent SusC/RagA subfamily outer membrane receptor
MGRVQATPLIIIDGVIQDADVMRRETDGRWTIGDLDPEAIDRIEVIKGAAASALYGEGGRDGVIMIYTIAREGTRARIEARANEQAEVTAALSGKITRADRGEITATRVEPKRAGAVVGARGTAAAKVEAERAQVEAGLRAKEVEKAAVKAVAGRIRPVGTVTLGERDASATTSTAVVAPKAAQDAITVTALSDKVQAVAISEKNAVARVVEAKGAATTVDQAAERGVIAGRKAARGTFSYEVGERSGRPFGRASTQPRPLFYVDGVRVDDATLDLLDPRDIERIEILKGAAAAAMYGDAAKGGVIHITMKKR